jgi:holo-[acyl-carrier protein] synthase
MIAGLGVDIVPFAMLRQQMHRPIYLRKVYTSQEIDFCFATAHPEFKLAAVFAIKEACMKALGAGIWQGVWFTQIEVLSDEPCIAIRFRGVAARFYDQLGAPHVYATCSYHGEFALAAVILERKDEV